MRCLMVAAIVSLVFAGAASASVKQGDTELEFMGGFITEDASGDTGLETDSWFASGGLGYFLNDNLQVSASAFGYWVEMDLVAPGGRDEWDVDIVGVGGKARWHFMPANQLVPYVGAQLFYADADVENTFREVGELPDRTSFNPDGILWGPIAGLRFELNDNNDFFAEYQYHIWDGDIGSLLEDGHTILIGIVHQFK